MTHPRGIIVALDGPAGAGKSTVAKLVAQQLEYALVDTGAIYRSVALLTMRAGLGFEDDVALAIVVAKLAADGAVTFRMRDGKNRVTVLGEDVSDAIRTPEVSKGASIVSQRPIVRQGLLALQRKLAGLGGAVLEGRDIGTVVCPQAQVKFFLDASPEERARRRFEELKERGEDPVFADVLKDQHERDILDRTRAEAPLKAADDAVLLDCTKLTADEVVAIIVAAVRRYTAGGIST